MHWLSIESNDQLKGKFALYESSCLETHLSSSSLTEPTLYDKRWRRPAKCASFALGSLNLHSHNLQWKLTTFPSSFFISSKYSPPWMRKSMWETTKRKTNTIVIDIVEWFLSVLKPKQITLAIHNRGRQSNKPNQSLKQTQIATPKCRKTHASKSQLVLPLIGWESDKIF